MERMEWLYARFEEECTMGKNFSLERFVLESSEQPDSKDWSVYNGREETY